MALKYFDGFDLYTDAADVRSGGYERHGTAGSSTFSTSNGRYGGGCLQGSGTSNQWIRSLVARNGTTIYIAFAYYWTSPAVANDPIIALYTPNGTLVGSLVHNDTTNGNLRFNNGAGVSVGTATAAIPAATWAWIEIKCVLGTSSSTGAAEVRVNGSAVITTATNILLWGGATDNHCGQMRIGGCNAGYRLDDLVVMDSTGSYMNNFIGDAKVETLYPAGKSNTADWTGGVSDVDDAQAAKDDDTSYISSATSGHESLFKFSPLANRPTTIHALQMRYAGRATDATTKTMKPVCDMRGNRSLGSSTGMALGYAWRRGNILERDPAGNAWAYETVRDARFGLRID